jgi:6-phosphofructokinase 1
LGHAQQGGNPTPFDRNMGTKMAARALEHLIAQAKQYINTKTGEKSAVSPDTATLLGLRGRRVQFTPAEELCKETDFDHRLPSEFLFCLGKHPPNDFSRSMVDEVAFIVAYSSQT